jgi:decaprenylphospho-beta-D-erythro-pentofuranosid-2-ulose 2-reductase
MSQRILIVGATSAIAREAARLWAARGDALHLMGRRADRLQALAEDLTVRGASAASWSLLDFEDYESHGAAILRAAQSLSGLDVALIAHGMLPNPEACAADFAEAQKALAANFLSFASLLTHLANYFEQQRRGRIGAITSVAGDRGRKSSYVYAAAKAGVSVWLEGLRGRLAPAGVSVTNIKPGYVDTPMTAHLRKNVLFASAARVGAGVVRALDLGAGTVYLPWFWRPVMVLARALPDRIFNRLNV